jgi:hypothetical protein
MKFLQRWKPRHVFFSFHYAEDIWRANQIRNSWVTKDWQLNAPVDKAPWESIKRQGDEAVKRWINNQLKGCCVTVVLIGRYTSTRPYVRYEIKRSHKLGKGLLGIRIHRLNNQNGEISLQGTNPFDEFYIEQPAFLGAVFMIKKYLSSIYKTYDWVNDDGPLNFTSWVEEAARMAGR